MMLTATKLLVRKLSDALGAEIRGVDLSISSACAIKLNCHPG